MKKTLNVPNHVAIIMDGNGRWAKKRLLPRSTGHYFGGMNVQKIANYANNIGIKVLTLYAFSTENWNRPVDEVNFLMTKPIEIVTPKIDSIVKSNIKIIFIGRKDRVPKPLLSLMIKLESLTINNTGLLLNIAFDYGAYDELITAISKMKDSTIEELEKNLMISTPVDLLIRTSGEQRLSNFLLWQAAYAELYFTKKHWPAFTPKELSKAIIEFNKRDRRYGKIK
ncbi:polyprenyl diphosphate synthase [Haploplasma axanthum]|nr:polyprenyl diphosphate synthase [Haploplasma axanthum]